MELQYLKALKEHDLSIKDLPEDARIGIDGINDVLKGFAMLERKGKNPTERTLRKLKAMDKWVTYEIYDLVNGTDKNDDEMPEDPEEIVDEIEDQIEEEKPNPADEKKKMLGEQIDKELEAMHKTGRKDWEVQSIRSIAPRTYSVIYDGYEDDDENGVKTSNYTLIETDDKIFTINKN